jgi:Fic family protein
LCEAHRILLQGVRGEHKSPGEFRISQNWIGSSLRSAVFVPPTYELVGMLMSDLENFLHNDRIHVPKLIRIAIAHYQFETIHPFLDGNGRIGRLLITLYLVDQKMLGKLLLYLSQFFERNKEHYYQALMRTRTHNELLNWIKYLLIGVRETAEHGVKTLSDVLALKEKIEAEISTFGRRSHSALALLKHLFQSPYITNADVSRCCGLTAKPSNDLVNEFVLHGYLKEITGFSRNRIFRFDPYVAIFE